MCQSRLTTGAYTMITSPTVFLVGSLSAIATVVALLIPSKVIPDQDGYEHCIQLHPDRYCRIANGFHVEPLQKPLDR